MKIRLYFLGALLFPFVVACKNNAYGDNGSQSSDAGLQVYRNYCLVCHQSDGSGVPGMFPPLIQTEWVQENDERLIKIILQGLSGEIEVNGEIYNMAMPAHDYLNDQQVADVLTYIRKNFKNNATAITPDKVKQVRNNLKIK